MKRLLFSLLAAALALPTAVNAFPWSSDIVVFNLLSEIFNGGYLKYLESCKFRFKWS